MKYKHITPGDQPCERCGKEYGIRASSMFNRQLCCQECIIKEKEHPQFQEAVDAVLTAMKNGNLTYEGIGLPPELE